VSGYSIAVAALWLALSGCPDHTVTVDGHAYVVRCGPPAYARDRGTRVTHFPTRHARQVQVVEKIGKSERIVWQGEWEGDDGDCEGIVREARRRVKR
jgi:hypothetical protein